MQKIGRSLEPFGRKDPFFGHLRPEGEVRPQNSEFLDSCAEICGLSGEAIENP